MNIRSLKINSQIQNEELMNAQLSYQPHWVREDFVDFILQKIKPTFLNGVTLGQPAPVPMYPCPENDDRTPLEPTQLREPPHAN